ncbi:MAG: DUF362 domain-containing protein [Ignavibacteria bacterium]|jgi:uncharacterized protein (DUF362 family)
MNRRDFFKKGSQAGLAATAYFSLGSYPFIQTQSKTQKQAVYDLAAIKGGEPDVMFKQAIEALGGIKNFVKPNQNVVVKPNIGWDVKPDRAANTNPKLVGEIVKQCLNAGAKNVYVFDHTCNQWNRCYKNSGIEDRVIENGGKIIPGNNERNYHEVTVAKGFRLKEAKIHEQILECDVFINVPVLKNHSGTSLSIGMKNLMGIVWDRGYWHRNDLHQCIADFTTFRVPDLTVVDAYAVMKRNGPRGVSVADVSKMKSMIISKDPVAADAAAAKLFGVEPKTIAHINIADKMKLGTMDLSKLNISRMKV